MASVGGMKHTPGLDILVRHFVALVDRHLDGLWHFDNRHPPEVEF